MRRHFDSRGSALLVSLPAVAGDPGGKGMPLWEFYDSTLAVAKYIDLTHAIAPGGPIGEGFADFKVGPDTGGRRHPRPHRQGASPSATRSRASRSPPTICPWTTSAPSSGRRRI